MERTVQVAGWAMVGTGWGWVEAAKGRTEALVRRSHTVVEDCRTRHRPLEKAAEKGREAAGWGPAGCTAAARRAR
jgi:hypothetical protein